MTIYSKLRFKAKTKHLQITLKITKFFKLD